jgi:hypothetical protein
MRSRDCGLRFASIETRRATIYAGISQPFGRFFRREYLKRSPYRNGRSSCAAVSDIASRWIDNYRKHHALAQNWAAKTKIELDRGSARHIKIVQSQDRRTPRQIPPSVTMLIAAGIVRQAASNAEAWPGRSQEIVFRGEHISFIP